MAERLNRALMTEIRAVLTDGLPQWLWGEAAYTACYLYNRTPRHYDGNRVATPKEIWTVKKPEFSHIRVFGYVARAQLAREQRNSKLDPTSIRRIMVGYRPVTRQYRVYDPGNWHGRAVFKGLFRRKKGRWTVIAPPRAGMVW